MRRRIAIFAVVTLLLSAMIAGMPAIPVSAQDNPVQQAEIAMVNPGFEDEVGEDGKIPGWNVAYTPSANVSHQVSSEQVKSGNYSLHLKDYSNTESVLITSDKYEAAAGKFYKATVQISPNDPKAAVSGTRGGSIYMNFYDANGEEVKAKEKNRADYSTTNKFAEFVALSLELEAPAGTKYVTVSASITPVWVGDTYFDDFTLTYRSDTSVEEEGEEDLSEKVIASDGFKEVVSIPVPNAGFERNLMSDGTIQGWRAWSAPTATAKYERSSQKVYAGKYSLKITDLADDQDVVLESMPLAVKPGVAYTASAMMNIEDPDTTGATLLLRFFNEQNVRVGEDVLQHYRAPINEWYKAEVKGLAPADTKYAKVFALVNRYNKGIVYYDDFMFTYERELMKLDIAVPENVVKNQTFTVQLGAENAAFLTGADLKLAFDAQAFEFVEAAVHPDFGTNENTTLTSNVTDGVLAIQATRKGNEVVNGNIGIVNVTFKVKGNKGNTILALKAGSILKTYKDGAVESKTFPNDLRARISIMEYMEDVNHDGVVNLVDLLLVAKHVEAELDSETKYYDLNGDGKIDIVDVGLLAQALAAY
ncbi:dockerin type I domain-containing protein [Paenibacillus sp. GCM10027626]|uniref:dockerin type I domain-containing protein n=1 Tax=Paenibacillus sp. GCM10027626 TaxID=3273411 RepID=UPI003626F191